MTDYNTPNVQVLLFMGRMWSWCSCNYRCRWPHHPSSNITTITTNHHHHRHKHHCSPKWRSPPSYLVPRLASLLCSLGNCRFSKCLTCLPMCATYSSIKGKLPSEEQTQRMKRLNSGRLLEKFGQSVKTPIKSQALIAPCTSHWRRGHTTGHHFCFVFIQTHWAAGEKIIWWGQFLQLFAEHVYDKNIFKRTGCFL